MEYNRFLEIVKNVAETDEQPRDCSYEKKGNYLTHSYETGGMSGGNCWNEDEATSYTVSDPESDFIKLEEVLSEVAPTLTFLQFKKLNREVQTSEYTDYEYYGNCTYYVIQYIDVKKLYKILKNMDLI